jgi:lysine-specific demethylase 8
MMKASEHGPTRIPIPEMTGFDRERFDREFRGPSTPVVLRGAAADWPAVAKWSPEYFATNYGTLEVAPSVNLPDTEVPYQFTDEDHRRTMTVAEFVDWMATGDRCYIDQMAATLYSGIEADYSFDDFAPPDVKAMVFWMGARTCSGLHYDYVDNFFAQVHGTKQVILAAPDEARHLHLFGDCHTKSQVAPQHPDLKAHPRFREATVLESTLQPGDVLFLPKAWWHYFASSERSISLSCWHGTPMSHTHDVRVMMSIHSPGAWLGLVRDFFWYGMLNRPYRRRLYSPAPTGRMLYELVASMMPFRRQRPSARQ